MLYCRGHALTVLDLQIWILIVYHSISGQWLLLMALVYMDLVKLVDASIGTDSVLVRDRKFAFVISDSAFVFLQIYVAFQVVVPLTLSGC